MISVVQNEKKKKSEEYMKNYDNYKRVCDLKQTRPVESQVMLALFCKTTISSFSLYIMLVINRCSYHHAINIDNAFVHTLKKCTHQIIRLNLNG